MDSKIEMLAGGLCVTIIPYRDGELREKESIEVEGLPTLKAAYDYIKAHADFESSILLWKNKTEGKLNIMLPLAVGTRDDFAILGSL